MKSGWQTMMAAGGLGAGLATAEVTIQLDEQRASIRYNGEEVALYRGEGRIPCIYPLLGPTGSNVTRHYPFQKEVAGEESDHPHHVSFWVAHGKVNGVDFWLDKEPANRIVHQGFTQTQSESSGGKEMISFAVDLTWQSGEEVLLQEQRSYAFTFTEKTWLVDVTSRFMAPGEVVFGDTKEGSFAIRMTPSLRVKGEVAQGQMVDSEGRKNDDCWGQRSKWVAYHGPDAEGEDLVLALMDHRDNLRHPTWWHARDYGLLAANPFGRHDFEGRRDEPQLGDFTLEKGETLTQSYRLVLSAGTFDREQLGALWEKW
ncbi:PmoA family protein [Roseibacillus ishigakijimensis]|uniref:PmoA family protein n=1 Tax=Roseibacillus ishigakijimensis TaxID=454146 RepID=A0A934RPH2_9BACT|nr:PmoA family protein [Roseibacillus ishigakijimensis]MBK1833171.1 PmoA family protein [Roseibacillus ishigakijimensis]